MGERPLTPRLANWWWNGSWWPSWLLFLPGNSRVRHVIVHVSDRETADKKRARTDTTEGKFQTQGEKIQTQEREKSRHKEGKIQTQRRAFSTADTVPYTSAHPDTSAPQRSHDHHHQTAGAISDYVLSRRLTGAIVGHPNLISGPWNLWWQWARDTFLRPNFIVCTGPISRPSAATLGPTRLLLRPRFYVKMTNCQV